MRGTGFCITEPRIGLTAAHVVANPTGKLVGMFCGADGMWTWRELVGTEKHPKEDVAVFQLRAEPLSPILRSEKVPVFASFECDMRGYPADIQFELIESGMAQLRPDLVFSTGHVRRRRRPVDFIPGSFASVAAETDFVAGRGCSGAPVIGRAERGREVWAVAGIYLGEHLPQEGPGRGFFILEEAYGDWVAAFVD